MIEHRSAKGRPPTRTITSWTSSMEGEVISIQCKAPLDQVFLLVISNVCTQHSDIKIKHHFFVISDTFRAEIAGKTPRLIKFLLKITWLIY